jgi:hypothetical protein
MRRRMQMARRLKTESPTDAVTPEGQCRVWIKRDYGTDLKSQGLVLDDMIAGCVDGFGS